MRILKISFAYRPFLEMGGPAVKVPAIAEHLVERGHQVTVATLNHGGGLRSTEQTHEGVRVVYLAPGPRYRVTALTPGALGFYRREVAAHDVVHIYGLYDFLGPPGAWIARRREVPYVVEPLGMHRPVVRSLRKKRLYHTLLGDRMIRGAASLVATSEQERVQLVEDGVPPGAIAIRRNGIDLRQFSRLPPRGAWRLKVGTDPGQPLVLFLGRLVPIKGLELLIGAFAGLDLPDKRLVLVGPAEDPAYVRRLETLVEEQGLRGSVSFAGPLYGEDKLSALVDADVVALTSRSESFGIAAAEAVACGTPVVVTEGCGIASHLGGRAGVVVPFDQEAVGAALREVLTDEALRTRLVDLAPAVARELSWSGPVAELEEIYRTALDQRGPRGT